MRRLTFEAGALFAGRMPMTSCYVAGGVTNDTSDVVDFAARCDKFKSLIQEVGLWIVQEYVPIAFALGVLYCDYDNAGNTGINAGPVAAHDAARATAPVSVASSPGARSPRSTTRSFTGGGGVKDLNAFRARQTSQSPTRPRSQPSG